VSVANVPIIKDLTAENMTADTPAVRPTLRNQPVMAKRLGIEVVDLKARMMHMRGNVFGTGSDKEALQSEEEFQSARS
jgi:hypothetical protein